MIDYPTLVATLPPPCPAIMMNFADKDSPTGTKLPMPFTLPLPDMPSEKSHALKDQVLRVHFAEDHGFLTGVCGLIVQLVRSGHGA